MANIPPDITDDEVLALAAAGVRAFRINLYRGGDLDEIGTRAAPRRHSWAGIWRSTSTGRDLPKLAPRLRTAPRLVIDHLGMTRAGLPALLDLVKEGAYVKASGFGRIDHDVPKALRAVNEVNTGSADVRVRPPGNTSEAAVRAC